MEYVFGVRSVLDGVSKYYVQSDDIATVGDLVSFDTNEGEQFAMIEAVALSCDTSVIKIIGYTGEIIYPINCPFYAGKRRTPDAGTP